MAFLMSEVPLYRNEDTTWSSVAGAILYVCWFDI